MAPHPSPDPSPAIPKSEIGFGEDARKTGGVKWGETICLINNLAMKRFNLFLRTQFLPHSRTSNGGG
jgi:hypothetical protein